MGLALELADVTVESLVPGELRAEPSIEAFLSALPAFDGRAVARRREAELAGDVLRYVGIIERTGKASVALARYPTAHAFAHIRGSDNALQFTTARYREQPLVVQGPGAGPEVTAGGVFADLLRLAHYLGAPSA